MSVQQEPTLAMKLHRPVKTARVVFNVLVWPDSYHWSRVIARTLTNVLMVCTLARRRTQNAKIHKGPLNVSAPRKSLKITITRKYIQPNA